MLCAGHPGGGEGGEGAEAGQGDADPQGVQGNHGIKQGGILIRLCGMCGIFRLKLHC